MISVAPLHFDEFESAIKQIQPDKAFGPDGLNPAFHQHFWHMMDMDILMVLMLVS